jgi:hypothetical protein
MENPKALGLALRRLQHDWRDDALPPLLLLLLLLLIIVIIIINRNTAHVECKNKGYTRNNWSDWDHFEVIQKIRERHARKL